MASSEGEMTPSPERTTAPTPPSLEELSRRGVRALFLPYIIGLVASSPSQQSQDPREVIVFVNFRTGSITMIDGGSEIDGLLRSKDGPLPASKASIEAMPTVEVIEDGFECAICLTEFQSNGEFAKEMPCKHRYHPGCIEKWLGIHGSCPICRYRMPVEEEEQNTKSGSNEQGDSNDDDSDGNGNGEGEVQGDGASMGRTGFVFHIYVAGSRRRGSRSDSDLDTSRAESGDSTDNLGEGNSGSGSDMEVDYSD